MELTIRKGNDVFVPAGGYRRLEGILASRRSELSELPAVVLSCFDRRTRMLPFIFYDSRLFPAGARAIAGAVHQAGFTRTRAVFDLWNPNFRPSAAKLDGRPLQMLLVSSMQMHSRRAFDAIRDAWTLGKDRPLIIVGGPKAMYEPYHYWGLTGPNGPVAPDAAVTGEAFVLLDLLHVIVEHRGRNESLRTAFERARQNGALDAVPGLVYLDPRSTLEEPLLVDTGLQRLVQHLDEMPDEVTGLRLMEPPHRSQGLSPAPLSDRRVGKNCRFVSLLLTQGCKFNCPYCPIPAMNQKTWRFRSPEGVARQLRTVHEAFGIRYFFGTDDNFFNRRDTAEEIFRAIADARLSNGQPLGPHVRWGTEATQFDTFKNKDLLPLARAAGLRAVWFGIEDLTAELVNKGQKPEVTIELFREMRAHRILPMAMMMYHEGQPLRTPGSLYGLANQVNFLREAGAVSMQIMVHSPAIGTREYENTYRSGKVLKSLGNWQMPDYGWDGNRVVVAGREPMWKRQIKLLLGYGAFYNPLNFARAFRPSPLREKHLLYQTMGSLGLLATAARTLPYLVRLLISRPTFHDGPPLQSTAPVRQACGSFSRLPPGVNPNQPVLVDLERLAA